MPSLILPGNDPLFTFLTMNAKQAKELALVDFIRRLGHEPSTIRGDDVWFRSPFRPDERTPSFKVDARRNIWYDHGRGEGGTIIDFVELYNNARDVSAALSIIESVSDGLFVPMAKVVTPTIREPLGLPAKPVIERVSDISDRALEDYIRSRSIPLDLARIYFKEIDYRVGDRSYKVLGFQNDSAGYEVRNANWKGALGTKDITTFPVADRSDFVLFEGSFDFLSTLAYYETNTPKANVVVLNSLAMLDRTQEHLVSQGATKAYVYFDHDQAGRNALEKLELSSRFQVKDASSFYQGFKDVNEFLKNWGALDRGSREIR